MSRMNWKDRSVILAAHSMEDPAAKGKPPVGDPPPKAKQGLLDAFRNFGKPKKAETDPEDNTGLSNVEGTIWDRRDDPATKPTPPKLGADGKPIDPVKDYINAQNFSVPLDAVAIQELAAGKPEKFNTALEGMLRNVAERTLRDSMQLNRNAIDEAVGKARKESGNLINATNFQGELRKLMPFSADPQLRPIIDTVGANFLRQEGATNETAAEATLGFVKALAKRVLPLLEVDGQMPGRPTPGGRQYGGDSTGEEEDFVALLTGKTGS